MSVNILRMNDLLSYLVFLFLIGLGVTAEDRNEDGLNVLHITNKYFDTDVHICRCNVEEFIKNFSCFTKMEALLYVFEDKVFI